jgi:hypothetical protein
MSDQGIASELGEAGADFMLAGYWDTKPLVLLSAGRFDACAMDSSMVPYAWMTNVGWCYEGFERWNVNRGKLAWVGRELEPSLIAALGPPDRVIEAGARKAFLFSWTEDRSEKIRQALCRPNALLSPPSLCNG